MNKNEVLNGEKEVVKIMINLIALVICIIAAIIHSCLGNIDWVLLESILALTNLPFVIHWIKYNK